MDALSLLREAIRSKHQVVGTYHGLRREFCPHVLGATKGEPVCLAYQFGGDSSGPLHAGSDANWRCFRVRELSGLTARPGVWHTCAPKTGNRQTCVEVVELQVR